MSNFQNWTIKDFPDPPWTKPQIEAWYGSATDGEKKALDQSYYYEKIILVAYA